MMTCRLEGRGDAGPALARLSGLSAFLPAHNEAENILAAAGALLRVLPRVARRWELIIVNDGSSDRTGALAEMLARRHRGRVRVVHHPHNQGYGAALRSGLAAARFEYVFFTDADRQFDPCELPLLLEPLDRAEAVVGFRHARADCFYRRLIATAWNRLVCRLLRLDVRDVNCAFKVFRRSAVAGIQIGSDGATASAELMAQLVRRGNRIVEIPVAHFPRPAGMPSGGRPDVIVGAFVELLRLWRRLRTDRTTLCRRPHQDAAADGQVGSGWVSQQL